MLAGTGALISCSEQAEVSEFDNWQDRNAHFIDSIAAVAKANADGKWKVIKSFTLSNPDDLTGSVNNYIYVQKLEDGLGDRMALYNDSVRVHYMGRLMPSASYPQGYLFDKSYSSYVLNDATDVPTLFAVNGGLVNGFTTVIMHMVEGERCRVYIPSHLGYGDKGMGAIPAYSTLVFDIKMARIYRYKIDTNTAWH